jgi:hypothetical protein
MTRRRVILANRKGGKRLLLLLLLLLLTLKGSRIFLTLRKLSWLSSFWCLVSMAVQ